MLYVAWADGDLEPAEIDEIRSRLAEADLEDGCRHDLERWLDASRPPSAQDLRTLLTAIRTAAGDLSGDAKLSLVDLGVELARRQGHDVAMPERVALQEIGQVLGLEKTEISSRLLAEKRPKPAPAKPEPAFDVGALTRLLDDGYRELKDDLRGLLSEERFAYVYGLDRDAYRDQVLAWCKVLAEHGVGALAFPAEHGGHDDMGAAIAAAEVLGCHDLSLFVKFGVQFGLFAGSVYQLGTEKHHRRYLADTLSLALPGCFAMTETDHGSNVADVETVARYDRETREFEIETPHPGARKDYIGNAARHGRAATVFAQLEIGGESYGVHAFLVPIRCEDGEPLPGVFVEDCGEKMGLNGVDNGRLGFDRVRVPLDNLLDRFAQVSPGGDYSSAIAGPSKRFFTMLGTLVGGRVTVACVSVSAAKSALAIAVRYGARRRQFGLRAGRRW
jgi:acyl-CoA oxidase